jgi:hypothetical protein
MILKRAMKGKLDLMTPAMEVQKELMGIPDFGDVDDSLFAAEKRTLANMKKALLMVAGSAVQKLMMTLAKEQEILINIANMAADIFVSESIMLRTEKLVAHNTEAQCTAQLDMLRVYLNDAADRVNLQGKEAINSFAEGDEQRMLLLGLKRFTKTPPYNTKEARRRVAKVLIDANAYCF